MNRYAFKNLFGIEGFNIAWYGVIITCGMLLGILIAMYRAKQRGLKSDIIIDFLFVAIPSAVIGARLYYVVFEWKSYAGDMSKIFAINQGGLAIYGGVIGGIIVAIIFCKIKKFPIFTLLDLAIPSLILGQVIGRWGNFINQEAFGNIIENPSLQFFPIAVYIEELGEWHQATFFYESAWNTVLLFLVFLLSRKKVKDGVLLSAYFIGYGIGRFLIEGLRTDSLYILPGIRVSQILSILLAAAGIVLLILIRKGTLKSPIYKGKYLLFINPDSGD